MRQRKIFENSRFQIAAKMARREHDIHSLVNYLQLLFKNSLGFFFQNFLHLPTDLTMVGDLLSISGAPLEILENTTEKNMKFKTAYSEVQRRESVAPGDNSVSGGRAKKVRYRPALFKLC